MDPNITNPDLPVTGDPRIDHWLALIGALVPLMSAFAGFLNNKVRAAQVAGAEINPAMLHAASLVNVLAVNLDKAGQLAKLAKGRPVSTTTRGILNAPVVIPVAPVAPAQAPAAEPAPAAPAADAVKPE